MIDLGIYKLCLKRFRANFFEVELGSTLGPIRGSLIVRFVFREKGMFFVIVGSSPNKGSFESRIRFQGPN